MKLTPNNFLSQIKQLVVGGGIGAFGGGVGPVGASNGSGFPLGNVGIGLNNASPGIGQAYDGGHNFPDGGFKVDYLVTATGIIPATTSTGNTSTGFFQVGAGSVNIGSTTWIVPRDYDVETDYLNIRILMRKTAAGANVVVVSTGGFEYPLGGAVQVLSTGFAPAFIPVSTNSTVVQEINYSGNNLIRDSFVILGLSTNGGNSTAGQELQIAGIEFVYCSCLVAFGDVNSTGGFYAGYNKDALGFDLR